MDLHISLDTQLSRSAQIYEQIRDGVRSRLLRPGEAVPATRTLATRLGISRTTVASAYDRLVAEGLLVARPGAGTFVRDSTIADRGDAGDQLDDGTSETADPLRPRPVWAEIEVPFAGPSTFPRFDFHVGLPDARLFPYAAWRNLLSRQLRVSTAELRTPWAPEGVAPLRSAIARHVGVSRGLRIGAEDVLVTSGIQQALDLIGRILLEPGARVAVEEPGYFSPRLIWRALGAEVVGVPVDAEGLVVDALPADARLVYVTPAHQMPSGVVMSPRRRAALLAWARRHDAAIVEDDYDSEFRYTDQALEPLHSLDGGDRVLYLGSFSKVLLPTLRLGYVVAPHSLRAALRAAKFVADWYTNMPTQAALAEFIDSGGLSRHVRRVRHQYRQRHDRIVAALAGPLARWLEPVACSAGLHLSAYFTDADTDVDAFLERIEAAGIVVSDFSQFSVGRPPRPGIVFGYGAIPTDRVEEGLDRLAECFAAASDPRRSRAHPR